MTVRRMGDVLIDFETREKLSWKIREIEGQ